MYALTTQASPDSLNPRSAWIGFRAMLAMVVSSTFMSVPVPRTAKASHRLRVPCVVAAAVSSRGNCKAAGAGAAGTVWGSEKGAASMGVSDAA